MKKILKVPYFDYVAAEDILEIFNEGKSEVIRKKVNERNAEIAAKLEATMGAGFDLFSYIKNKINLNSVADLSLNQNRILTNTITNTVLSDFLNFAEENVYIIQFENGRVYPIDDSITKIKMYTPYLLIAKDTGLEYDISKFDEALEKAKGYYEMLININGEDNVLRFNIKSFRNNYGLSDLTKMKLVYYAIQVGECKKSQLNMKNEFEIDKSKNSITAEELVMGKDYKNIEEKEYLKVFDVILAGVVYE